MKNPFAWWDSDVTSEPHEYVQSNAIMQANSNNHGAIYKYPETISGFVESIYSPADPRNKSKIQYEYRVQAVHKNRSYILIHCTLADGFGGFTDFETYTLKLGQNVNVQCILGSAENGLIVRGNRNFGTFIDQNLGHFWMRKFNDITNSVTDDSNYYVQHVAGNKFNVSPTAITITDGSNNTITVDKQNKKITISDGNGETLIFDQTAKKVTLQATALTIEVAGDANITASGTATVKADKITLNGESGQVVTNSVYSNDFITGIPIPGVSSVKAG